MNTTRRSFIKRAASAIIALGLIPTFKITLPEEVVLPEKESAKGNRLMSPNEISREALKLLHNNLTLTRKLNPK
jgi:hypothetical protein